MAAFYRDVPGFTIQSVSDPGWLFYRSQSTRHILHSAFFGLPG